MSTAQLVSLTHKLNADAPGIGVPGHIAQQFLEDAENDELQILRHFDFGYANSAFNAN